MIDIQLGFFTEEKTKVEKTPEWGFQSTGNLREAASVVNPVFTVSTTNNIALYNYAYIPSFGRYYFITEIVALRTGLWEIHCHVDVLNSFSSHIKNNKAIISRNSTLYNLYLDDPDFIVQNNRALQTIEFPNKLNTTANRNFMLMIAGGRQHA